MRSWTIAFSLGVCLALLLPALPEFSLLSLLPVCLLACLLIRRWLLTCAYCLGLVWTIATLQLHHQRLLPEELEQKDIWLRGTVSGLPRQAERSVRVDFLASALCPHADIGSCKSGQWQPLQGRGWINNRRWRVQLNDYQELDLRPGDQWQLQVRLKRPRGFANPATFDYEAWLWEQGFMATGYIRDDPDNLRLASPRFSEVSSRLRLLIREKLQQGPDIGEAIGDHPVSSSRFQALALLKALAVGDRHGISSEQWALFSLSGTNHLMVISGLHIGLVAMLCYQLVNLAVRLCPALILRLPAQRLAAIAAILGALGYSTLAGFSLPTRRAFIMVTAFMLGRLLLRQTRGLNSLCLAMAVILLLNPLAPVSAGFWLSFGAVAILLLFAVDRPAPAGRAPDKGALDNPNWNWQGTANKLRGLFMGSLQAQWALFIGLFPLLLIHFQQFSIIAPAINLLAIPLIGLLVVPLALAGVALMFLVPDIALWFLLGADFLLYHFMQALLLLQSAWPGLLVQLPAIAWWGKVMLLGSAGLLLAPLPRRFKSLAVLLLVPLVIPHDNAPPVGSLRLHVLDVGQGLAVVVETATHTLVYDTGPAYSERFNAGAGLIMPFMRGRNMPAPDILIVSHGHADHSGGLQDLRLAFPHAELITGEPEALAEGFRARPCLAGQHWHHDGVDFGFLHPESRGNGKGKGGGNEQSCVLRISTGRSAVLLTGDIERGAELRLQREAAGRLRADVVVAPHHGSRTSSTSAFVAAMRPAYVIFSTGYLNRFGHPAPEVMGRYREQGAILLNTAYTGAISFDITEAGVEPPHLFRRDRRRVWRSCQGCRTSVDKL